MSDDDARTRIPAFLREHGLLAPGEHAVITRMVGGVSSDLWKVDLLAGAICVKGALPRLKVAHEWFAPVSRNHVEYEWLKFAQGLRPGQVPRLLAHDEAAGLLAMEYLPPSRYPVWKSLLLAGRVDVDAARAVGELVGHLHAASAADPDSAVRFATDTNFEALRIDPYLRVTARAHPDLTDRLAVLADRTAATHLAVAHGDVSPKNILIGPSEPVLLDAECAWFGDPAFDVAFCINHLLIKSVKMPLQREALVAAAHELAAAHAEQVDWEPASGLTARVVALLPALALARVDGSSPVEYLDDAEREIVRRAGRDLLCTPAATLDELCERWIRARAAGMPSVATPG